MKTNKMYKILLLALLFGACDSKQEKMDELYGERTFLEKQIDSIGKLRGMAELKLGDRRPGQPLDTATMRQFSSYSIDLDILKSALKKIDFSIDSISKR